MDPAFDYQLVRRGIPPKALKRRTTMTTKPDNQATTPVFARLTPAMTKEQIKRNLIDALKKSGFRIHPSPKQPDEGGAS